MYKRQAFDYSQAELRMMAHLSGDETYLDAFAKGADPHLGIAAAKYGVSIEEASKIYEDENHPDHKLWKTRRKQAKQIAFGLIYGIGEALLAVKLSDPKAGIIVTKEEAHKEMAEFFEKHPKILKFKEKQEKFPMAVSNWWESRQGRILSEKSDAELSLIKGKREFMKLQIKKKLLLAGIFIFSVWIKGYSQGVATSNPLQYAAIQKGEANVSAKIKSQTDNMNDLAGVQGSMVKDAATMKKWEKQYNAYLTTAKGYAEKIAAAATLYQDGMQTLTYLWEIDQARKINPEGVFASMSMNNLYMETAAEFTKAYRILNKVIKAGGKESMLNGAERTMLLWQLSGN